MDLTGCRKHPKTVNGVHAEKNKIYFMSEITLVGSAYPTEERNGPKSPNIDAVYYYY
jgi:hypothetical protein